MAQTIISSKGAPPRDAAPGAAAAGPQVQRIVVDEGGAGQRLDNFLLRLLKGVPKTHVYRVIRSGEVRQSSSEVGREIRMERGDPSGLRRTWP